MKAISYKLVGESWRNGIRIPGFGQVNTDDSKTIFVPESECKGLNGVLSYAERQGVDVTEMRDRTAEWVRTGK